MHMSHWVYVFHEKNKSMKTPPSITKEDAAKPNKPLTVAYRKHQETHVNLRLRDAMGKGTVRLGKSSGGWPKVL